LGNWLGTTLPFDERWTIEPISDSTLYPAYYIISKYVNDKSITTDELTEEFFDYVFLGRGKPKNALWKTIREDFQYWYPLDVNLGGKEHQTVHFPVFLMNHVALLDKKFWPRGIFVNWWVTGKGSKISKSKGGAEPIPEAIKKYGVDSMRLYYATAGSHNVDIVWDEHAVFHCKRALERIMGLAGSLRMMNGRKETHLDHWLLSRMHRAIRDATRLIDSFDLRAFAMLVYYSIYDDILWYQRRKGNNKNTIKEVLALWAKLMNPITPHVSEELSAELVSASSWPTADEKKITPTVEAQEELIKNTLDGIRNVRKLAKMTPKTITLFIAEQWKYDLFTILHKKIQVTRDVGQLMQAVMAHDDLKKRGGEINKIVLSVVKDVSRIPHHVISREKEWEALHHARTFLEEEFNCPVNIIYSEESTTAKARQAMPGKVGILIA
jgi:leucyl-tRNA synthetase